MIENHDFLIRNMIDKGISSRMKKSIEVFTLDQNKFIIPHSLHLDHFYEFTEDFCLNGTFLKKKTDCEYIIFDPSGKIQGITSKIY